MDLNIFKEILVPNTVLDIGANVGHFCEEFSKLNPNAIYTLIEPNVNCIERLKNFSNEIYNVCLWSDESEQQFFINKTDPYSTGNSLMRENTDHFCDSNIDIKQLKTTTLDKLFVDRKFDLIKIDTQGSELHIINGGIVIFQNADYVLLEVSFFPYNKNGSLAKELIDRMKQLNFKILDIVEYHNYTFEGLGLGIIQCDILFINKNIM